MNDRFQVEGHRPVQLPQPGRIFLRHLEDQAVPVLLVERRP